MATYRNNAVYDACQIAILFISPYFPVYLKHDGADGTANTGLN